LVNLAELSSKKPILISILNILDLMLFSLLSILNYEYIMNIFIRVGASGYDDSVWGFKGRSVSPELDSRSLQNCEQKIFFLAFHTKPSDRPRADWQPGDDGDSFSTAAEERKRSSFTLFCLNDSNVHLLIGYQATTAQWTC
jgi:hypothetical protein